MKGLTFLALLSVFLALPAWADEKPAPAEVPPIPATPAIVEMERRATRFCTDTLLVYDKDGKPEAMMFMDKNGMVFATVKLK